MVTNQRGIISNLGIDVEEPDMDRPCLGTIQKPGRMRFVGVEQKDDGMFTRSQLVL